jgi:molybdopterin molybdotransferase
MIPVAEAQARLLALAQPLSVEQVTLGEASGRWAAAPIHARRHQPAADLSAMDGYALRFAELPGPWRVAGESAAGAGFDRPLLPGEAARIFTGAPVPEGADTILIQEDATRDGDNLRLTGDAPSHRGLHVRFRGSDFASDAALIDAGALLTPPRLALAAIGGHGVVAVRRRARVALISTGDELVVPGAPTPGVMLPASNAPMLAAMLDARQVTVSDRGIVPDRIEALTEAFLQAAGDADVIVTTGGASVGDRDLVHPALEAAGASLDFWRVAMRPGKPLMAGRLGGSIVLGLPGNPVSAFVTARLFLLPLLASLGGAAAPFPETRRAPLATRLGAVGVRADYIRGRTEDGKVRPVGQQDSAALFALAEADVLIVRPPNSPPAEAGEMVEIISLDR